MQTPTTFLTNSMVKVTPDWTPTEPLTALTGWEGEQVSFQVAWLPPETHREAPASQVRVDVTGAASVRMLDVDLVAAQVPCWKEHSDGYIVDAPALLPDLLRPVFGASRATHIGWHSIWVDVTLPAERITVTVWDRDTKLSEQEIDVTTVARPSAAPSVDVMQWFHADCLATYYRVETWSEEHWSAIENQVHSAARMGTTMLLTPVWTPPLDTEPGINRPTTQLLDITLDGGRYTFGHERLDRWLGILKDAGIAKVEVPHLFTQWGATRAPQIRVVVDGEERELFGWHTPALDPAFQDFLAQAVAFLISYFDERIGRENTVFHISDEPNEDHLDTYVAAKASVAGLLEGCRVLDALSHPEYAEHVATPIVATDAVPAFRAEGMEPEWVYHCVAQSWDVANRFIAQEGIRTRALGWQMYKGKAVGFLHWGFNFYYAQLSRRPIDPFHDTSAGGGFISGDPFIVYPGPNLEPIESQRHRLFAEAMADLAVAEQAEALIGRDAVLAIIDPDGDLDYAAGWIPGEEWLTRRAALDKAVIDAS